MRLARYTGNGEVAIVEEEMPCLPEGGLLVKAEACGLCSGELMHWYMDKKVPHVLGHEVAGRVIESDDERFPVGSSVFPHHHAPCWDCDFCRSGLYVHCAGWKATMLVPGGMSEFFAVAKENLVDTIRLDSVRPQDAALVEPFACVVKAITRAHRPGVPPNASNRIAVIGLGALGLMCMLFAEKAVGYERNLDRVRWAKNLGLDAREPIQLEPADTIVVFPGSQIALDLACQMLSPGGTIVLFAPMPPGELSAVDFNRLYFLDATITTSYSCSPRETAVAADMIKGGLIRAEQVVSDFISLDELPRAYQAMKKGEILKAMVVFE
jgi:L-iditol 2-dehydrogenase